MSEPALLAAIAAAPDDDLPCLVYADWLDENGRPLRAEFIRLQVEIAKKETLPRAALNVFSHLWKRQQEILDNHRDELLGPLAAVVGPHDFEFRRGFLNAVTMTADEYRTHGKVVVQLVPPPERVEMLHVGESDEQPFQLDAEPLDGVTHLCIAARRDEPARIRGACGWPRLQSFDMESCHYGDDNIAALFAPPCFPALQDLDLSFNDLTDAGVVALLRTGMPQRLKRLVLGGNPIGDDGAVALAEALRTARCWRT